MSDTEIALLPCPFDGGKARLTEKRRGNYRRVGSYFQGICGKCRARGPLIQDSPQKAAEAWNAREAAMPQRQKSPPATPCECRACLKGKTVDSGLGFGIPVEMTQMIVCARCGNKRCPHANDHRNTCTNSNEPGQPGSAY
ncbi:TPA: Lar family restriction alleviation protein [Burkholderia vietnamiensis]|nr:Lar family restriction alleviation protein [Burkholderia vietnamiensis]